MVLKEKIVREFKTDEDASAFINKRWKDRNLLFTWASFTSHKYNDTPVTRIELTEEEKKMKKDLRKTFTLEVIREWGRKELSSHVQDDIKPHPNAKGYREIR